MSVTEAEQILYELEYFIEFALRLNKIGKYKYLPYLLYPKTKYKVNPCYKHYELIPNIPYVTEPKSFNEIWHEINPDYSIATDIKLEGIFKTIIVSVYEPIKDDKLRAQIAINLQSLETAINGLRNGIIVHKYVKDTNSNYYKGLFKMNPNLFVDFLKWQPTIITNVINGDIEGVIELFKIYLHYNHEDIISQYNMDKIIPNRRTQWIIL